jgi:hypothetical protein
MALVIAVWAVLLLPGTAAAYGKNLAWGPSAGGALKSYTFDAYSTICRAGYRLRIEFELGKVTATSAYIKYVRFYYSRYNNIEYTTPEVFDTYITDDYGHVASVDDNNLYPWDTNTWRWDVGRTFNFTRDKEIVLDRHDDFVTPGGCGREFQFTPTASAL